MTNTGLEISPKAINTREEVAHAAGVSDNTIAKVKKIEAVLDAEVRIGELMRNVPKQSGQRTDIEPRPSGGSKLTKHQVIKDAGFTQKQAERFQQLASHPEAVAEAKAEARENDDIVSRSEASHWRGSPAISPE